MPAWSGEPLVAGCLRPWAERLLDVVHPGPGERCLDVLSDGSVMSRRLTAAVGNSGTVHRADELAALRELVDSVDVVVSLFGLAHAADAPAVLAAMYAALRQGGRLACVVWGGRTGALHEVALLDAVEQSAGVRLHFVDAAIALGKGGAAESLIGAAEMRHLVRLRRVHDVVRFDSVDHLWAALVDERPLVSAALRRCSAGAVAAARRRCAESFDAYAAADGTLRIPVEAVLIDNVR